MEVITLFILFMISIAAIIAINIFILVDYNIKINKIDTIILEIKSKIGNIVRVMHTNDDHSFDVNSKQQLLINQISAI